MRKHLRGWSLIELTIILVVLSILCAILAPVIGRFVRNAKICRAREDIQAIGVCIWMYIEDTANSCFYKEGGDNANPGAERMAAGGAPTNDATNVIHLLVSDGDIPENDAAVPADSVQWLEKVLVANSADFLENHLVTNTVGYRTPAGLTNGDADDPMFARTESGGFNSEFAWRGPYMTPPIDPDPWGNRYAVNVEFLHTGVGHEEDVAVLSAGPDEAVETDFAVNGMTPGDDDLIYILSANSRP